MAQLIALPTVEGDNGHITIIEEIFPMPIKRVFFIQNVAGKRRGHHRHYKSSHLMICLKGECKVYVHTGNAQHTYHLHHQQQGLMLNPQDWREMYDFSEDCLLMCISNQFYDPDDYIYEPYPDIITPQSSLP